MASGRVGGTRSLISGAVGDDVYSIVSNGNGTYSQKVSAKATIAKVSNTPVQAAQRMATAMVESLMRDLKEVGKISMQSGTNKSKSLNAFSAWNIQRVLADMKANWYTSTRFVYQEKDIDSANGGRYLLSSGTLPTNHCKRIECLTSDNSTSAERLEAYGQAVSEGSGLVFACPSSASNIREFLQANNIHRSDIFVWCAFIENDKYSEKTEEVEQTFHYRYFIASINPFLGDTVALSEDSLKSLFLVKGSVAPSVHISYVLNEARLFNFVAWRDEDTFHWYYGGFTVSYQSGRKQIKSSEFIPVDGIGEPWLLNHRPTNCLWSWYGLETRQNMPSPYV